MNADKHKKIHSQILNIFQTPKPTVTKRRRVIHAGEMVSDVPKLTEEKLISAYLKTPSKKTQNLFEWLAVKENLDIAEQFFYDNIDDFQDIKEIIEQNNSGNFRDFIQSIKQ